MRAPLRKRLFKAADAPQDRSFFKGNKQQFILYMAIALGVILYIAWSSYETYTNLLYYDMD